MKVKCKSNGSNKTVTVTVNVDKPYMAMIGIRCCAIGYTAYQAPSMHAFISELVHPNMKRAQRFLLVTMTSDHSCSSIRYITIQCFMAHTNMELSVLRVFQYFLNSVPFLRHRCYM